MNNPAMDKRKINIPWLFEMAWRDSRRNRARLTAFYICHCFRHCGTGCYLFLQV
jgi:hypothetical protein